MQSILLLLYRFFLLLFIIFFSFLHPALCRVFFLFLLCSLQSIYYLIYSSPPLYIFSPSPPLLHLHSSPCSMQIYYYFLFHLSSSPLCLFCCILYPTILIFLFRYILLTLFLVRLPLPTPTAAIFSLLATSSSTSDTQPGLDFGRFLCPFLLLLYIIFLSSPLLLQSVYYAFTLGSLRFSPFTLKCHVTTLNTVLWGRVAMY